jgi:hypothetical protein
LATPRRGPCQDTAHPLRATTYPDRHRARTRRSVHDVRVFSTVPDVFGIPRRFDTLAPLFPGFAHRPPRYARGAVDDASRHWRRDLRDLARRRRSRQLRPVRP